MNSANTTNGGYIGSDMYKSTLNTIFTTKIEPDFKTGSTSHIMEYKNLLSSAIDGVSQEIGWYDRKLDLMSEVNVYGTTVWSSSGWDVGIDSKQYAIFQLRPDLIDADLSKTYWWYWLKAVVNSTDFVYASGTGDVSHANATSSIGVRPRFLID